MYEQLQIIRWPDPRLKAVSAPVEAVDANLRELSLRMLELMRTARGVGLAAPQVGINQRLFVMNHSGEPGDDRVYVNPDLHDLEGDASDEEGCLSLPDVHATISRAETVRLTAFDLDGNALDLTETGYIARIWQHEFDHLNGVLLLDRMGSVARISHRKAIREMEEEWEKAHPKPVKKRR